MCLGAAAAVTLLAAAQAVPAPAPPPASPPTGPSAAIATGLEALHRGEYRRALDDFKRAADADPAAPGPLFYPVFARWWQGLFADGSSDAPESAFDDAYAAAVKVAETRLETAPGDADALATLGTSRILRAHVEAMRGNYWRSGQEARRGKKALEQALAIDPGREPALFGMGALNYYADRVPLIVKGMRLLLFIPGGDASLGLKQIRAVAGGGGTLATDGRLLLGIVCADHYQQAFDDAQAHLEGALGGAGGSPLIGGALGDLQIRLARYGAAAATLEKAAVEAGGDPDAVWQRRWLALGQAEALAGDWRLDEAQAALDRAIHEEGVASDALVRVTRRLSSEIALRRAAAAVATSVPGAGSAATAGDANDETTADARDERAAARGLLAGRRLLDLGRAREAVPVLQGAADHLPDEPSAWLAGSIHLYLGIALKQSGNAQGAHQQFDKAIATRRFRAADRARLELGKKGEDAALCAP
jgi:tetratricopeptide (TPR) repeat protein